MAYVVKCVICGKISIHHRRCLKNNGAFPRAYCMPHFKTGDALFKDGWVVIARLGHSEVQREYRSCCHKPKKEEG